MEDLRALLLSSSGAADDSRPPLAVLYSRCHAIHSHQEQLLASRDADLIGAAVAVLAGTEAAVESAGVFSANEDRDDLATADVKYLLVPYYRGSLYAAAPVGTDASVGPSSARLAAVTRAVPALRSFIHRCEQYEMLGVLGRSAVDAAGGPALDPAAKRTFKVEKFKREKALNAALGSLEARRLVAAAQEREDEGASTRTTAIRSTPAAASAGEAAAASAAAASASAAGGGGGGGGGGGELDEEDERQLWCWRVELGVLQALDLQASLRQEAELLAHAVAREAAAAAAGPGPASLDGRSAGGAGAVAVRGAGGDQADGPPTDAEKAELLNRLRSICRDLDGGRKEQAKRDVFRPSHTMPTMTIEEAGEIDHREAVEREARQEAKEAKEAARRAALSHEEADEEDSAKQRAWDDWRDAHPKGYGNSKLRPCS